MKKIGFLLVLVVFVISVNLEYVEPQGVNCYDSCSTGCVQRDTRLMLRCDRKCSIRCSPDVKVEGSLD